MSSRRNGNDDLIEVILGDELGNLLGASENRNTLNCGSLLVGIIVDKSNHPRCESRIVLDLIQNRNTRSACPNNKCMFDLACIQIVRRVKSVSESELASA